MPAIKTLFTEAWEAMTGSVLNIFFLGLVNIGVVFAMLIIGAIFLFALGFFQAMTGAISSQPSSQAVWSMLSKFILPVGIYFIVFMILGFIFCAVYQIGSVLAIAGYKEKPSFGSLFKRSFGLILPYFGTALLVSLLAIGGFFVFMFPALIISFFLVFTMYEVILNNKKGIDALKSSVAIMSQHFGEVLIRVIILMLISWGAYAVVAILSGSGNKEVSGIFSLIYGLFSFVYGYFVIAYYVVLYKHARANTDFTKKVSMLWMWVVSIVGWVVFIAIVFAGITYIAGNYNTILKNIEKETTKSKELKMKYQRPTFRNFDNTIVQ